MCQEDTEGEIKREQTQEQRTEKDSMYELSAKNDRLMNIMYGILCVGFLLAVISVVFKLIDVIKEKEGIVKGGDL